METPDEVEAEMVMTTCSDSKARSISPPSLASSEMPDAEILLAEEYFFNETRRIFKRKLNLPDDELNKKIKLIWIGLNDENRKKYLLRAQRKFFEKNKRLNKADQPIWNDSICKDELNSEKGKLSAVAKVMGVSQHGNVNKLKTFSSKFVCPSTIRRDNPIPVTTVKTFVRTIDNKNSEISKDRNVRRSVLKTSNKMIGSSTSQTPSYFPKLHNRPISKPLENITNTIEKQLDTSDCADVPESHDEVIHEYYLSLCQPLLRSKDEKPLSPFYLTRLAEIVEGWKTVKEYDGVL